MNKKTGTVKLNSGDITLRRFRPTDFFSVKKWLNQPSIIKYTISRMPPNNWDVFKFIVGKVRRYGKKDFYSWVIEYQGKAYGLIELIPIQNRNAYSVSYKLDFDVNGKGITTEALKMVIDYMSSQGIDYLISVCDVENIASKRVMEKAGMINYGSFETNHKIKYKDGTVANTYHYKHSYKTPSGE